MVSGLAGPEADVDHELAAGDPRRGLAGDARPALDPVQTPVAELDRVARSGRRQPLSASLAPEAPHLEDVGEVGVDPQAEGRLGVGHPEVRDLDDLVEAAGEQRQRPRDVQPAPRQDQVLALTQIGVGEVDGDDLGVAAHGGAQEQRPLAAEAELEVRQVAGAAVEQPLLAAPELARVAAPVEHREGVAGLQHPRSLVEPIRGGEDVEAVVDLDHVGRRYAARIGVARDGAEGLQGVLRTRNGASREGRRLS